VVVVLDGDGDGDGDGEGASQESQWRCVTHVCLFCFSSSNLRYGYNTWMEHNVGLTVAGDDIPSRYLTMLYTAFLMLIGEGMDMETDVEKAYGAFVVLVGTIVTAVIVGNVSFVVSNQNSTAFQYQSKIDMISDEMRALHLPGELQTRTLQYYDYLWNRHRTFDPNCTRFTADLSPTLRKEILLHMNRECVLNCDFFRDVSNECIIRLVHSFKFAVFLNSDVVAEEGELAAELVFVIHGSAKVVKRGRVMPVSLLSPGDYFGEKSLLMHHRNAVSVVAIENCDTRVLEKMDFEDLCIDFPELRESILKRSDHMDVTEYDRHKKRRTSLRVASTSDLEELQNLHNLDLSISLEELDSSTKVTTPKGGVFSFEPPATTGEGKHVDMDISSGGSGRSSFATGSKARISQVLSIVEVLNDRVADMDEKQNTINAKLDLLLQRMDG
jgi:CRP-like cAMP-binding protein